MTRSSLLMLSSFCLMFMPLSVHAEDGAPKIDEAYINKLIGEYIKAHPQEILDSLEQHQVDMAEKEEQKAAAYLQEKKGFFESDAVPTVGNPDADIHVVEFFDYSCGYCKRAFNDLALLLEEDENVKVTFVDFPILGPGSLLAAKWSMAAKNQGDDKFFAYHSALMKSPGTQSEEVLEMLAEKAGLDVGKLKEDVNDPAITAALEKNREIAVELGIRGTPAFIIGDELFRGYLGYDGLTAVIQEKRNEKPEE